MAKRRRHRQRDGGRHEPALVRDVRRAVAADHPLDLLALVSGLLDAIDDRNRNPFDPEDDGPPFTRERLLDTFLQTDAPESTAVLAAVATLTTDDVERARLQREIQRRGDRLPAWLTFLPAAEAYRTVEMVDVLGDTQDVVVGVRLPTGHELTAMVLVDHHLGAAAKDGFVVPESIAGVSRLLHEKVADPDIRWHDIPPADARARLTEAIDRGSGYVPRLESDSWPACRPLLEWVARLLPAGGAGYEHHEWTDDERQAIAERFLASPLGQAFDDPAHRELLDTLLWFACDYGTGDPLQWSPTRVERLLLDWIPRKIEGEVVHLAKAPALLRAFIRFALDERGIRPGLVDETVASVDDWEHEYQQAIRSPRLQGPLALLAAAGAYEPSTDDLLRTHYRSMLDTLRAAVGGEDVLADLDVGPLPDEPFDWTRIPDDIAGTVRNVLALVDDCCDRHFDVELRTACRRLLARAAAGDPGVFRRRAKDANTAAAVVWAVGIGNEAFDRGFLVKDLVAHFGIGGNPSQRGHVLLAAAGVPRDPYRYWPLVLGSPDYLTAARRRRIVEQRDRLLGQLE